jgi:hypothetical protein
MRMALIYFELVTFQVEIEQILHQPSFCNCIYKYTESSMAIHQIDMGYRDMITTLANKYN